MKLSKTAKLEFKSPAFRNNGVLPDRYIQHDGENIAPPLQFQIQHIWNVQSLALVMEDPDVVGKPITHWLMWNIPPDTQEIEVNALPPGALLGQNSFGDLGYTAPAPEFGTHRYQFHLYALDTMIALPEGSSREELDKAMHDHILAHATLNGMVKGRPEINQRKPVSEWADPYKDGRKTRKYLT